MNEKRKIKEKKSTKRWTTPQLKYVGEICNIVQGGGKAGSNMDADPTSLSAKAGGG